MKKKLDLRCITAWALCLLLCIASLPQTAFAATLEEVEQCTLRLTFVVGDDKRPVEDAEFRLYRVAEITDAVTFRRIDPFRAYDVTASDWLSRAATLSGYVSRDALPADRSGHTDEMGEVSFEALEKGLYLVVGGAKTMDGYIYTPTPFLLSLPYTSDGVSWEANVETYVKYTRRSVGGGGGGDTEPVTTRCRVLKVWDDESHEDVRPESVTVDLLRDNSVYDTVTLSAENNWRHDWTDLAADANWQVAERGVEGYSVSVTQGGITFVITNTYRNIPQGPSGGADSSGGDPAPVIEELEDWDVPLSGGAELGSDLIDTDIDTDILVELEQGEIPLGDLPQTGQLWWPVPVLAMGGIVLLLLGCMRRGKWDGEDEA